MPKQSSHGRVARLLCALALGLGVTGTALQAAEVQGRLEWANRVELSTPVSGVVAEVSVRPGATAKADALLLRLDPRRFEAAVRRAEAQMRQARALAQEEKREYERSQELYDRTLLSEHDLTVAEIAHIDAQSRLEAAQAQLTEARLDLEYSEIRAPFDAVVLERAVEPGQTVVTRLQSTPLLVVAEAGRMRARANVGLEQLAGIQPGRELAVAVGGGRHPATVVAVGMEPVSGEGAGARYPLVVEFAHPAGQPLRAGENVTVVLP